MKYNLKEYLKYIRNLETNKKIDKEEISDLLTNIKFFQHERLIHLIVTVFVGISTILFFGIALENELISFIILALITLVLFIFYILHYYFLENSVQELYKHYWNLKDK